MRAVDLRAVATVLLSEPDISMVSFLMASTLGHAKRIRGRCAQAQKCSVMTPADWDWCSSVRTVAGVPLVPMLQWLDSTHVAKVWEFLLDHALVIVDIAVLLDLLHPWAVC